jgi:parvulin-like peptidyl-prolyl isomerase
MRAGPHITRTKDEALFRIQECLERAQAGEKFEDLAREYSDCPSGPRDGHFFSARSVGGQMRCASIPTNLLP